MKRHTEMIENQTTATYSRQCYLTIDSWSRLSPGILVIGGDSYYENSVEFWSPSDPEEGSCKLNDYPREMYNGPTANLVSGQLVACYGDSCEINNGGEWMHLAATSSRKTTTEFSSLEDMTQEAQSGSRWTALLFRWIKAEIVCGVYQDAGPPCSCRRYKISYDNSKWIQNIKHNIGNLDNLWYIFANKELFETFFRFKMFVHLLHSFL